MTVVTLRGLASALGAAAPLTVGQIIAEPWAGREPYIRVDGADVEFPREVTVDIIDGEPVVEFDLPPLEVPYRLRVTDVAGHQALERFVMIPASGPVNFEELEVVNPETFESQPLTPPLFESLLMQMFGARRVERLTREEFDALPTPRPGDVLYVVNDN